MEDRQAPPHLSEKWAQRAEKIRRKELEATPRWYNPWLHLATTFGVCASTAIYAAMQLNDVSFWQWWTIPAVFIFANFGEWWIHNDVLHKKFPAFEILYEKHTPMHHSVYTPQDMQLRSPREMRLVMMPAMGIVGIVAILGMLTPLLYWIAGHNVAYLFLATTTGYVAAYEISHLLYHVDPQSPLGKLPGLAFLRRHHTVHHDPRIMQQWNFNVTVPLADTILRTGTKSADSVLDKNPQPSKVPSTPTQTEISAKS